jgi:peptidoglycan/LPS O-acetylase OafA/YrhL
MDNHPIDSKKTINKTAYLDGIRGTAAFLVLLHHFLLAFYPAFYTGAMDASNSGGRDVRYGQSILSFLTNGNYCVCIFYVLSGFVLSRKYFGSRRMEEVISGAHRRFLRLYIPVAFTLILACGMMKARLFLNGPVSVFTHSEWWLGAMWRFPHPVAKLWDCLKFGAMFLGDSSFDTSLSTMTPEFFGSLFVFAFLAFTHHTRRKAQSLALVFIFCKLTSQPILACFVFGISLNFFEQGASLFNKGTKTGLVLVLLPLSLVLGSYPTTGNISGTIFTHAGHFIMRWGNWFHAIGAFFFILCFVLSKRLQQFFSSGVFRFLGSISFSIYLLHPLVIGSLGCFVFLKMREHAGFNQTVMYAFIVTVAACFFLSWLMAKYIDAQGMRLSKYVYIRFFKKAAAQELTPEKGVSPAA